MSGIITTLQFSSLILNKSLTFMFNVRHICFLYWPRSCWSYYRVRSVVESVSCIASGTRLWGHRWCWGCRSAGARTERARSTPRHDPVASRTCDARTDGTTTPGHWASNAGSVKLTEDEKTWINHFQRSFNMLIIRDERFCVILI